MGAHEWCRIALALADHQGIVVGAPLCSALILQPDGSVIVAGDAVVAGHEAHIAVGEESDVSTGVFKETRNVVGGGHVLPLGVLETVFEVCVNQGFRIGDAFTSDGVLSECPGYGAQILIFHIYGELVRGIHGAGVKVQSQGSDPVIGIGEINRDCGCVCHSAAQDRITKVVDVDVVSGVVDGQEVFEIDATLDFHSAQTRCTWCEYVFVYAFACHSILRKLSGSR